MPWRRILWFGLVGGVGFLVDTGVLYLCRGLLGLYGARVVSFLAAVAATWWLNRRLTFRDRSSGLSLRREFGTYLLLMTGGGAVNYGAYAWLVATQDSVARHPVLGVAVGSVAGMAVNLLSSRWLLFRHRAPAGKEPPHAV